MSGNIINCIEKDNSFNYVKTINGRINLMSKVRSKTLLIYGTLGIIVMLIILVLFLFKINLNNRIGKWFKIILLLLYKLPIIFIISSLFTIDNLFKFVLSLVLLIILFIYIYNKYFSNRIIYLITYSYFIIIVIDILSNGFFTKYSVMSHDPIIGARYFGIGNEMVGLFLTGTVLTAGLLYEKYNNKIVTILVLSISVILVGHPKLGANVGGTIALISASIYFILDMMNKELSFKNIVLIIVVASLMVIILGYIDVKLNPNPTHLGRTILSINDNGLGIVKNIMNRKLLMNIRLVGISIWTKVIIINIFIQMVMSILFEYWISKLMNSKLGKGLLSSIVGSIVGFLVNDSGLILSAITINLITIFMLFSIIDYEE